MKELIETLNHTGGLRTIFYGLIFVVSLIVVCKFTSEVLISITEIFKRKK